MRVHAIQQLLELLLGNRQRDRGGVAGGAGLKRIQQSGHLSGRGVVLLVQLDQAREEFHHVHQRLRVFLGARHSLGRNGHGIAETNAAAGLVDGRKQVALHRAAQIGIGNRTGEIRQRHQRHEPEVVIRAHLLGFIEHIAVGGRVALLAIDGGLDGRYVARQRHIRS